MLVWNWVGVPGALTLLVEWSLATVVLVTGPGGAKDRLLALLLFVDGLAFGCGTGVLYFIGAREAAWCVQALFVTGLVALPFCYLAFIGTLSTPLARPLRGRAARVSCAVLALAGELFWLTHRSRFVPGMIHAWYAPWDGELGEGALYAIKFHGIVAVAALLVTGSYLLLAPRASAARRQAKAFVLAFGVRDVATFLLAWLVGTVIPPPPSDHWTDLIPLLGTALTSLLFALLVSYGILRVQLFDIDLRVKRGIRRTTVAAAFLAVFLITVQIAQNVLASKMGIVIGGAAAGLLLFALAPIQKVAQRVADGAMPAVAPTAEYLTYQKLSVYRYTVETLLEDGPLDARARKTLDRLRERLHIRAEDARLVESEVSGPARPAATE